MTFKPEIGKRYVLADGRITESLRDTSLTDIPFSALTIPAYIAEKYGHNTEIFFSPEGEGLGGDKSKRNGFNSDFQIVTEYNDLPVVEEVKVVKKVIPGNYKGVDVRLDGTDLVIEVPEFYATAKNLDETIKVLQNLQTFLE